MLDGTLQQVSKSERVEDKTGPRERGESYDLENHGDGKPAEGDQVGAGTRRRSNAQCSLLTDVRRNQNTACVRYCRVDG